MDNYTLVRNAIVAKQIVTGMYHDHHREMCPHVIGLRGGRRQALFYQFAGSSSSGLPPDGEWRCLQVDELKDVTVQDGEWRTSPSRIIPQTCVDEIDVEVKY